MKKEKRNNLSSKKTRTFFTLGVKVPLTALTPGEELPST